MDRYLVISSDGHAGPRPEVYRDYLDPQRHEIGLQTIMWGTDYPHPEGTWPRTREMMLEIFHGLPEEDIEAMLGGNAAEFYGFDTEKLAPLALRIGPERRWFRAD